MSKDESFKHLKLVFQALKLGVSGSETFML